MKQHIKSLLSSAGLDVRKRSNTPEYTLLGVRNMAIDTILDIGANTGQFARAIEKVFPNATIYCFEPLPDAYRELAAWAATRNGRVHALNMALGEESGSVRMHRHVEHTVSSSLLPTTQNGETLYPQTSKQEYVDVEIQPLDVAIQKYGDLSAKRMLVKLDVQGFEDRVLRGGCATIRHAQACISELNLTQLYQGQCGALALMKQFDELGFDYAGNLTQVSAPDGRVVYIDGVFVRRAQRQEGDRRAAAEPMV